MKKVRVQFLAATTFLATISTIAAFLLQAYSARTIPQAHSLHYLFIIDSSKRMAGSPAGGESKWNTMHRSVVNHMLHGLPPGASYGLLALGGRRVERELPCKETPSNLIVPIRGNNEREILTGIDGLEPRGVASLNDALIQARRLLFRLPTDEHKALYLFLGGGDECDSDPWDALKVFLKDSGSLIDARIEIVILPGESVDETIRAASDIIELVDDMDLANIGVHAPEDASALDQTLDQLQDDAMDDAAKYEPTAVSFERTVQADDTATAEESHDFADAPLPASDEMEPTAASTDPPSPTAVKVLPRSPTTVPVTPAVPTKMPTLVPTLPYTPSPIPSSTPLPVTATRTPTPTRTPSPTDSPSPTSTPTYTYTPTSTYTPTPTVAPTMPPHTQQALSSQPDVFSAGCWLANSTWQFDQFYQGQARITSDVVTDNERAGRVLRLEYSNISAQGGNYAGWELWMGPGAAKGIDLSPYSSLSFSVKGSMGGEELNVYLMMPSTNGEFQRYWKDVEEVTPVTNSWNQVVIPLSEFTSGSEPDQQVDLRDIQRLQMVFEWYTELKSGRIFIDDLCIQ